MPSPRFDQQAARTRRVTQRLPAQRSEVSGVCSTKTVGSSQSSLRLVAALILLLLNTAGCSTIEAAELNAASNQLPIRLGLYLEMLVDETGTLDVDEVRDASQTAAWIRSPQAVPTLGFSASTYWFRFSLSGTALAVPDLLLSANSPTLDRVDLFVFEQDQLLKQSSAGDTIPFSQLEIAHSIPLFSLADLAEPSQQLEFIIRIESQGGLEIPLELTSLSLELQDQQNRTLFYGFLLAFFLIGLSLCSVFLIFLRDRQFFGYTLFFASVSEDFQKRLFQEFARDEDYSEKDPSSYGLGMVIVKRLIEKQGGAVDFESKSGEGSTFFIRLPLRIGKA